MEQTKNQQKSIQYTSNDGFLYNNPPKYFDLADLCGRHELAPGTFSTNSSRSISTSFTEKFYELYNFTHEISIKNRILFIW